ncbi:polyprenyl synthetase family protein [Candidatus Vallotiella sp. (ex Adelges kitamiensis)]|uniref:polyprenyl synthetase family protein n=1 Tax=Candidatus Vallotiella sp. (ex Adelges kitamiensis) TaxID=2864217 RepID=UPI001CE2FC5D|nr:farnesyl diphosphate synthase [Candidatus Vallotia sp. (ex Adelges kitamiensis)]
MTFDEWVCEVQTRTESALSVVLPSEDVEPIRLHQAMRYAVLGGGKRVRPMLCHAAGQALGAPSQMRDTAACALELIHVYSMVHDDLPLMDNDDVRRDKPAVHIAYDEVTGLLVGDALQSQAFIVLSSDVLDVYRQAALMRVLACATGSFGMAGGQAIDLESVGMQLSKTQLEMMHQMKTGALLRAAVKMGAICGDKMSADIESALDAYAKAIGLAFQVVDDILDVTANSTLLGKTAGKDKANDKPTYVSIIGLRASLELVAQLRRDAYAALVPLGERGLRLAQIADLVAKRIN